MKRTAVINVVGLTERLLGEDTPRIMEWLQGGCLRRIRPAFPAVTCTAQSNYLTGVNPSGHGIVGNGWYQRELAEIHFWKQSNHLVQAPKIWDDLRQGDPQFTCAQLFWWYNMYSNADFSITPRPLYPADGRKVFDIHTWPYGIRSDIKKELGEFPFFGFWGPAAGQKTPQGATDVVSRWIASAACWMEKKHAPTLNLVYLPHLDYNLQRWGPCTNDKAAQSHGTHATTKRLNPRIRPDLRAIDDIVGGLIRFWEERNVQVLIVSEYGITNVDTPIHLNRVFRQKGWITVKEELGLELLDAGASRVFAVTDHQVAHVYLNDPSLKSAVQETLKSIPGVAHVLDEQDQIQKGLHHGRAGNLVAVAAENAWFTYYYWMDDALAPDFARTVDIHRKAGYDPVELFLDPSIRFPAMKIGFRLLQKKLGFRMLMDLIPLDAGLVKGSHGCLPESELDWPVLITPKNVANGPDGMDSTQVYSILRGSVRA